ncbi:cadmium-translocating P-type ATPase [candidate division KSB1 bacterium]|nr:cadmium-translocating P-type ATPase [candidate division KSB1 bacterium]
MEKELQLEIPLLLPEVEDEKDQCVERLLERVQSHRGIAKAHVDRKNGQACFCLHYDPNLVSLQQVQRWAKEAGAEVANRYKHESFRITDMDCGDCAASIEHILQRLNGVINVSVSYAAEKMRAEYDSTLITHENIVKRIGVLGYKVEEEKSASWVRQNWELVLALLSGIFVAAGFFGERFLGLPSTVALTLYILAYVAGGFDIARHALKAVLHARFDIDFLMLVAAIGAAILGEWAEGALLLFLFSFGHALEHSAMSKARNAIRALGEITPKTARVQRDGKETELAVEELLRGDLVIVRSGERIPIDGKIKEGRSAVDQSPITGESVPVEKQAGDPVFAGTVNGEGALEIEVTKLSKDSTMARVVQMVAEAQTQKSPTQRFTEKFERIFVPVVLIAVVLVIVVPPLLGILSWSVAFLRAMTMLVAASPCALAIATPAAILSGVAQAARHGVLVKGGVHLENLGRLDAMAFDKTGTITSGKFAVTDFVALNNTSEEELMRLAAAVESRSQHPLAQAVMKKAEAQQLTLPPAENVQSVTGRGVMAEVNGRKIKIGNAKFFEEIDDATVIKAQAEAFEAEGKTTMLAAADGQFIGIIALADQPREMAKSTLAKLKQLGIQKTIMITGDNRRVASAIAMQMGLSEYHAELMPDDKVAAIKELLEKYGEVAMVGDGVNDAPAMATSTVGIAMGTAGSDVALETADVALMADDLSKLPFAVALSRQARRIILQNLIIALGVIALLLPSALLGIAGIGIAIVFHEGSTLLVVANALRLLRFKR